MNWLKRILFLKRHIKKDDTVIQVGFSLDRLYSDVFPISWIAKKLIIVEPDPRSYFKLQKRKWLMKKNYVYYNNKITSSGNEYIFLYPKSKHNSIKYRFDSLKLRTLTTSLNFYIIPDIVILTCNGAEYDCLVSGSCMLKQGVKFIVANATLEIQGLLLAHDYKMKFEYINKQKLLVATK